MILDIKYDKLKQLNNEFIKDKSKLYEYNKSEYIQNLLSNLNANGMNGKIIDNPINVKSIKITSYSWSKVRRSFLTCLKLC